MFRNDKFKIVAYIKIGNTEQELGGILLKYLCLSIEGHYGMFHYF